MRTVGLQHFLAVLAKQLEQIVLDRTDLLVVLAFIQQTTVVVLNSLLHTELCGSALSARKTQL